MQNLKYLLIWTFTEKVYKLLYIEKERESIPVKSITLIKHESMQIMKEQFVNGLRLILMTVDLSNNWYLE